MAWYEDWFDSDLYDLAYDHRDEREAERLANLIERAVRPAPGGRVLDVGTGRGRHARVLARRGYRVTGLDLAPRAVAAARERAAAEGLGPDRLAFAVGDMREPFAHGAFDGVVNLFTSFGYFEDDADHARAVAAMAAALVPGGWLVQDFLNAPYVRARLVPEDERTVDGVRVRQERWLEAERVRKRITLAGPGLAAEFVESVRLLDLADFRRMYAAAGLALAATFGDYGGGPHGPESPRLILVARRSD